MMERGRVARPGLWSGGTWGDGFEIADGIAVELVKGPPGATGNMVEVRLLEGRREGQIARVPRSAIEWCATQAA